MMLMMRRKVASPALSAKSPVSPQLSVRLDGSPYLDLCPPTPQWDSLPSMNSIAQSPVTDGMTESQIAWTAYQGCSRRMNSACIANRSQSVEEQRSWWEETSRICRNAILLHSVTLSKQFNFETAKNLEILEHAQHVVEQMLDSITARNTFPAEQLPNFISRSDSISNASTLVSDELEPTKHSRRLGLSTVFGRMKNHLTTREPKLEVEKMSRPESMLYF